MNRKLIAVITAFTLALSFAGCGKKDEVKGPEEAVTNVTVQKVKTGDIENTADYTGEIKAGDTSSVSVLVSAEVKGINVEIGDYVNAGDVLMTLDTTQYQLAYNQASAAYDQALVGVTQANAAYNSAKASRETTVAAKDNAQASYNNVTGGSLEQSKLSANQAVANAQSAYDTALSNYNRHKSLFDIGAVSQVALDTAKTGLDNAKTALDTAKANAQLNEDVVIPQTSASARAGVNQAQAGINQAEAGIEQARAGIAQAQAGVQQAKVAKDVAATNLQNCRVTAPISGYITSRNVTVGQMATPGYEIFQIKNSEMVDVEINVTETVITSVALGTKAIINIDSAKINDVEGTVSAVAEAKNDATGMFGVKISIPNKDGKIKVGMIAEVSLVTETASDILVIDYNALLKDGDVNYVYVSEGDKAVRKDVVVGISNGEKAEILSGLKNGDNVIVDGKEFLSDKNNKIKIIK